MKQVSILKVSTGHKAVIFFNPDFEEYTVKFYGDDGQHITNADYFTDDIEDARGTAQAELARMKNED